MKRFLTVLLAAMLLCVASFAAAEDTHWSLAEIGDTHEIVLNMETPVHVGFMNDMPQGTVYARATRTGCANVYIIVTPSEISEGISMSDLDADGLALFKSLSGAQYIDPVITEKTTPSGNLYIQVFSNEGSEIVSYVTLFEGYLIQIDYYHPDFSKLSYEDHAFAEEILHGLWINAI